MDRFISPIFVFISIIIIIIRIIVSLYICANIKLHSRNPCPASLAHLIRSVARARGVDDGEYVF